MHLKEGTLLKGGTYKIIRFIASGGFGCTYEAEHLMLDKKVAIKEFFPKTLCNRDSNNVHVSVGILSQKPLVEKLKGKFVDEARSIAKLSHKGIVKVVDVFEENGTAYYVMDYIEGKSLAEIIKERGPLSEKDTLKYIHQLCDALSYIHDKNRLHLDIKPANIMIDEEGNATLIDFGASKQYDEESGENTSSLLGHTPGYAPLEQMSNDVSRFKPATDIYAIGATIYKCLTGKTPLKANQLAEGDKLAPLPSNVSEVTKNAINAAMVVSSKMRPQTVKDFVAILDGKTKETNEPKETYLDKDKQILNNPSHSTKTEKPQNSSQTATNKNPNSSQVESGSKNLLTKSLSNRTKLYIGGVASIALILICLFAFGGKSSSEITNEEEILEDPSKEEVSKNPLEGTINGHDWVDLGLPSGLKWATCNVGANSPEDYGYYFAWGETITKPSYEQDNCETYKKDTQWLKSNGYIGDDGNLILSHDAANQNWGESWRMPTLDEIKELVNNTTTKWTMLNSVKGQLVTSKINGKSIFLPAAGYRNDSLLNKAGWNGYCRSSTPYSTDSRSAYDLSYDRKFFGRDPHVRYDGRSVRPVSE